MLDGKGLRHLRESNGFSINDLAIKLNVSKATVHRWETEGLHSLKRYDAIRLSEELHFPVAMIYGDYSGDNEDVDDLINTVLSNTDNLKKLDQDTLQSLTNVIQATLKSVK